MFFRQPMKLALSASKAFRPWNTASGGANQIAITVGEAGEEMCDLQLAPLVERFGADHEPGREHRGKQDAKNRAEGAHEVKRDAHDNGDDRDGDPGAGLALEELPAAGDPG